MRLAPRALIILVFVFALPTVSHALGKALIPGILLEGMRTHQPQPPWKPVSPRLLKLMRRGRVLEEKDADGHTVLYEEARRGNAVVVETLVRLGAKVNVRDPWGWTPLHAAVQRGHRAVARVLLDAGADIDARDHWKQTPLFIAWHRKDRKMIRLLQGRGARY